MSIWIGILAAFLAAFVWGLNFIVPFVIGRYTVFDFALIRFVAAGLICLAYLAARPGTTRSLSLNDWLLALWLGVLGYLGYFLALVGAALYGGPVIAPAILGLVPIVLAIAGNLSQRSVPWSALVIPLALVTLGLVLIRVPTVADPASARSVAKGIALALLAVALWTWFGLLNQSALARRSSMKPGIWTALIMAGAGLGMVLFAPLGYYAGLFQLPQIGFGWEAAHSLVRVEHRPCPDGLDRGRARLDHRCPALTRSALGAAGGYGGCVRDGSRSCSASTMADTCGARGHEQLVRRGCHCDPSIRASAADQPRPYLIDRRRCEGRVDPGVLDYIEAVLESLKPEDDNSRRPRLAFL